MLLKGRAHGVGTLASMAEQTAVRTHALRKAFGDTVAIDDVAIEVARGEILAMLGPSGCGKTTFLRLVAGFERPDAGSIELDGEQVAAPGLHVPAERRRVGFVFQDFALFPHMTVEQNVGFGVGDKHSRAARVAEVLKLVGLSGLAGRYPRELSGGQQQRAALARALAPAPALILMDEPFSNLDADLRARVRTEVRDILRAAGATTIFVTHDQEEAFEIADRIAVMREGCIDQLGTPEEIYHTPQTRFVADFVGEAEFLPVDVGNGSLVTELGTFPLDGARVDAGPGEIMVRPEDIVLAANATAEARVVARRFHGPVNLSAVRLPSGRTVTSAHSSQEIFDEGEHVDVRFEPDHLVLFRGDRRVAWIAARERTGTDRTTLEPDG